MSGEKKQVVLSVAVVGRGFLQSTKYSQGASFGNRSWRYRRSRAEFSLLTSRFRSTTNASIIAYGSVPVMNVPILKRKQCGQLQSVVNNATSGGIVLSSSEHPSSRSGTFASQSIVDVREQYSDTLCGVRDRHGYCGNRIRGYERYRNHCKRTRNQVRFVGDRNIEDLTVATNDHKRNWMRGRSLSSSSSVENSLVDKSNSKEGESMSHISPEADARESWLHSDNEELVKKISSSSMQENWEEADRKLRLKQAIATKKHNEERSANVMRALRGNIVICMAKFAAWASSGSSAMLSEFIHSVVDCFNQALILVGMRDSNTAADRKHPYGYGKSLYFWSLISALGTFWMGAGVSMRHSCEQLLHPSLTEITWELWYVLVLAFVVDGYVLAKTISDVRRGQPEGTTFWHHLWKIRDPALLAILLEDGAACLGVFIAGGGIALTAATGLPLFDGLAGVGVSCLLGTMGLVLVKLNKEFLLGQATDRETLAGIERILLLQESIEHVHSMQSQVIGHGSFSVKAEVDFDGTYLAAKLLPRYQREFNLVGEDLSQELRVLLSWYAEDVMRVVEREVRRIEYEIRKVYPGAVYIELEPYSKDFYRYAIDDATEALLKRNELEVLNRFLTSLYMENYSKLKAQGKLPKTLSEDKKPHEITKGPSPARD